MVLLTLTEEGYFQKRRIKQNIYIIQTSLKPSNCQIGGCPDPDCSGLGAGTVSCCPFCMATFGKEPCKGKPIPSLPPNTQKSKQFPSFQILLFLFIFYIYLVCLCVCVQALTHLTVVDHLLSSCRFQGSILGQLVCSRQIFLTEPFICQHFIL